MPSEKQIRDVAIQQLGNDGWICWWPGRIKFRKAQDIFTMWDMIAARREQVRFIQFTTKSNKSSHIQKIKSFRELYELSHQGELWLWDQKKGEFEIINL